MAEYAPTAPGLKPSGRLAMKSLVRRVGSLAGGDGVNRVLRLGAIAIIARRLSAAQFGTLTLAVSLAVLVFTVGTLGLSELGSRDVAAGVPKSAEMIGRIFVIRTGAVAVV